AGSVFMDTSGLELGVEFKGRLKRELSDCEVVIVVVGPKWLKFLQERPAEKKFDYVRFEISQALKQADTVVIPILLGNARIPTKNSLPTDLKALSGLNSLTFGASSRSALAKLIASVRKRDDPCARFDLDTMTNEFGRQKIVQYAGEKADKI